MLSLMSASQTVFLAFTILCAIANAQKFFTIPSPNIPDLDSRIDVLQGSEQEFKWTLAAKDNSGILDQDNHISVWVTSFRTDKYTKLLSPNYDSRNGGSFTWKVDLTDEEIDSGGGMFVYRLKPPVASSTSNYDPAADTESSRGFRINKAPPPSTTSSIASSTQSAPASSNTSDPNKKNGDGLSAGAKAGIGVGVAIGMIGLIGGVVAILFVLRRRHHQKLNVLPMGNYAGNTGAEHHYEKNRLSANGYQDLRGNSIELEDSVVAELPLEESAVSELPGTGLKKK